MQNLYQAFQPLTFGAKAVDTMAAESILREDMVRAYHLPTAGRMAIRPGKKLSGHEEALLDEVVQHLIDLAFLPEAFYEIYFEKSEPVIAAEQWQEIRRALDQFIEEDEWATQLGLTSRQACDEILPLLVQRLNELTSLDGDLILNRPLGIGEKSVYARVLHYRLRLLGQYFENETIPTYVDESALIRAYQVLLQLGLKKRDELNTPSFTLSAEDFQILGNAHQMFGHYVQQHPDRILFYALPEAVTTGLHSQWLIVWNNRFVYADNEEEFRRRIRQQTPLDETQTARYIQSRGTADTVFHTAQNRIGLRLLQIKLWMSGFYYGRIDGWWAALSHQALLELLTQEGQEKRIERFLIPVESSYQAINLPRLGALLMNYDCPAGHAPEHEALLLEAIPVEEEAQLQDLLHQKNEGIREFYRKSHQKRRRIYFGLKSLVVSAWRGIKRIIQWIKKGIQKIIGAVISFFKALSKRIREGILVFMESFRRFLHFVLGKPVISPEELTKNNADHFLLTRFSLDADTINLYSAAVQTELVSGHLSLIRHLVDGLSLFLTIATEIIHLIVRLGSLATPMGWIRLGFWIAEKVGAVLKGKIRVALI